MTSTGPFGPWERGGGVRSESEGCQGSVRQIDLSPRDRLNSPMTDRPSLAELRLHRWVQYHGIPRRGQCPYVQPSCQEMTLPSRHERIVFPQSRIPLVNMAREADRKAFLKLNIIQGSLFRADLCIFKGNNTTVAPLITLKAAPIKILIQTGDSRVVEILTRPTRLRTNCYSKFCREK